MSMDEAAAWQRAHQCLSELGYTDPDLIWIHPATRRVSIRRDVPMAVTYMALLLAYPNDHAIACWSCWSSWPMTPIARNQQIVECYEGRCPNEGPKFPPRELIVSNGAS